MYHKIYHGPFASHFSLGMVYHWALRDKKSIDWLSGNQRGHRETWDIIYMWVCLEIELISMHSHSDNIRIKRGFYMDRPTQVTLQGLAGRSSTKSSLQPVTLPALRSKDKAVNIYQLSYQGDTTILYVSIFP